MAPLLVVEYPGEPLGPRTLSLPGGVESGRMERAEGCGDFRGSGQKTEASSLGAWRGGSEKKQIKGEKIETTGNTQKGDRPMEELGWWSLRAWGRKQFCWPETWKWALPRERLEASERVR